MGILGSGVAGVASLASKFGYEVTGCDLEKDGHSASHLKGVDLVVATPAVFYQSSKHPEFLEAKRRKILMTWQEFVGKYLHKDKKVICVAGTHGKSTTTAMVGKLLQDAGLDPLVILGAKVPGWDGNSQFGKGKYFVTEADEFYDNFLNYRPMTILLNNIEFDHPDYFKNEKAVSDSYKKFVDNLVGEKTLIVNPNSIGIEKLLGEVDLRGINLIRVDSRLKFNLKIPGKHNVANAQMVWALGRHLGIKEDVIKKSLENFEGIGRRMELVSDRNGIKIYDDYAHHPTAIKATLEGLRDIHKDSRIWAVVEAHGYQRTKALLDKYEGVFDKADFVVVGPIFRARDSQTFGITEKSIAEASKHKNISDFNDLNKLLSFMRKNLESGDVVLVMGAGKSNIWAQKLLRK